LTSQFLNGGKPFVDHLEVTLTAGKADFFSSSREGDSDYGVNNSRVKWIQTRLKKLGWQ